MSQIPAPARPVSVDTANLSGPVRLDLAPARWIWMAGGRFLRVVDYDESEPREVKFGPGAGAAGR